MTPSHDALNEWVRAHVALLVEGQSRLSEIVGTDTPDWELSISTGLITLSGHRLQYALLGSVKEDDNTWLWSWEDAGLDMSSIAVRRSLPLRGFGEEYGLWEFSEGTFSMDGIVDLGLTAGASIALVACPQIMGGAIFSGQYEGGRLYAVITDPQLSEEQPTAVTASKHINAARAYSPLSHRDFVDTYAAAHSLECIEDDHLTLVFEDGSRLIIDFDGDDCVERMHGMIPPSYNAEAGDVGGGATPVDSDGDVTSSDEEVGHIREG